MSRSRNRSRSRSGSSDNSTASADDNIIDQTIQQLENDFTRADKKHTGFIPYTEFVYLLIKNGSSKEQAERFVQVFAAVRPASSHAPPQGNGADVNYRALLDYIKEQQRKMIKAQADLHPTRASSSEGREEALRWRRPSTASTEGGRRAGVASNHSWASSHSPDSLTHTETGSPTPQRQYRPGRRASASSTTSSRSSSRSSTSSSSIGGGIRVRSPSIRDDRRQQNRRSESRNSNSSSRSSHVRVSVDREAEPSWRVHGRRTGLPQQTAEEQLPPHHHHDHQQPKKESSSPPPAFVERVLQTAKSCQQESILSATNMWEANNKVHEVDTTALLFPYRATHSRTGSGTTAIATSVLDDKLSTLHGNSSSNSNNHALVSPFFADVDGSDRKSRSSSSNDRPSMKRSARGAASSIEASSLSKQSSVPVPPAGTVKRNDNNNISLGTYPSLSATTISHYNDDTTCNTSQLPSQQQQQQQHLSRTYSDRGIHQHHNTNNSSFATAHSTRSLYHEVKREWSLRDVFCYYHDHLVPPRRPRNRGSRSSSLHADGGEKEEEEALLGLHAISAVFQRYRIPVSLVQLDALADAMQLEEEVEEDESGVRQPQQNGQGIKTKVVRLCSLTDFCIIVSRLTTAAIRQIRNPATYAAAPATKVADFMDVEVSPATPPYSQPYADSSPSPMPPVVLPPPPPPPPPRGPSSRSSSKLPTQRPTTASRNPYFDVDEDEDEPPRGQSLLLLSPSKDNNSSSTKSSGSRKEEKEEQRERPASRPAKAPARPRSKGGPLSPHVARQLSSDSNFSVEEGTSSSRSGTSSTGQYQGQQQQQQGASFRLTDDDTADEEEVLLAQLEEEFERKYGAMLREQHKVYAQEIAPPPPPRAAFSSLPSSASSSRLSPPTQVQRAPPPPPGRPSSHDKTNAVGKKKTTMTSSMTRKKSTPRKSNRPTPPRQVEESGYFSDVTLEDDRAAPVSLFSVRRRGDVRAKEKDPPRPTPEQHVSTSTAKRPAPTSQARVVTISLKGSTPATPQKVTTAKKMNGRQTVDEDQNFLVSPDLLQRCGAVFPLLLRHCARQDAAHNGTIALPQLRTVVAAVLQACATATAKIAPEEAEALLRLAQARYTVADRPGYVTYVRWLSDLMVQENHAKVLFGSPAECKTKEEEYPATSAPATISPSSLPSTTTTAAAAAAASSVSANDNSDTTAPQEAGTTGARPAAAAPPPPRSPEQLLGEAKSGQRELCRLLHDIFIRQYRQRTHRDPQAPPPSPEEEQAAAQSYWREFFFTVDLVRTGYLEQPQLEAALHTLFDDPAADGEDDSEESVPPWVRSRCVAMARLPFEREAMVVSMGAAPPPLSTAESLARDRVHRIPRRLWGVLCDYRYVLDLLDL